MRATNLRGLSKTLIVVLVFVGGLIATVGQGAPTLSAQDARGVPQPRGHSANADAGDPKRLARTPGPNSPARAKGRERLARTHILVKLAPGADETQVLLRARGRGMKKYGKVHANGWIRMSIPSSEDPRAAAAAARLLPGVVAASPDVMLQTYQRVPNDPLYIFDDDPSTKPPCDPCLDEDIVDQWGLFKVGAEGGWSIETGGVAPNGAPIIIAVLDSGVDLDHDDLRDKLWTNPGEIADGVDNDGNGLVDDIHGADFVGTRTGDPISDDPTSRDGNPDIPGTGTWVEDFSAPWWWRFDGDPAAGDGIDNNGDFAIDLGVFHGTFVAGIATAATDNVNYDTGAYEGIAGSCWNCKIMAVRMIDAEGGGLMSAAADAVRYAADNGAHIINASWGVDTNGLDPGDVDIVREAIDYAVSKGVIVVAAAGNSGNAGLSFPASMPNTIAVGSSDWTDRRSAFSSYAHFGEIPDDGIDNDGNGWIDDVVDIMAPGELIWSTTVMSAYEAFILNGWDWFCCADRPSPNAWRPGDDAYTRSDGTSFATPLVAGYIGVLLSANCGMDLNDVRQALRANALDIGLPGYDAQTGFGRLRFTVPTGLGSGDCQGTDGSWPIADAGPDQRIVDQGPAGEDVLLDGSSSQDPDGDIVSYQWFDAFGGVVGVGETITVSLPQGSHIFTLRVTDAAGHIGVDSVSVKVCNITCSESPLTIVTTTLADAVVGEAVNVTLSASGGTENYSWSGGSGDLSLPSFLTLSPQGVLAGTPDADGVFEFAVQVDDGEFVETQTLSLTVVPLPAAGEATLHVSADNAEAVYLNGVQISSSNDWTAGTTVTLPLEVGKNVIAIRATDAGGAGAMIAHLTLNDGAVIVSDSSWKVHPTDVSGWEAVDFDDAGWTQATTYGTYGAEPWKKRVGGFPASSPAQWIWTNQAQADDLALFRYTVVAAARPLVIPTTTFDGAVVGDSINIALTATGGTGNYSWSSDPQSLPSALTLSADGVLSGVAAVAGEFQFDVQVHDGESSASQTLSLTVLPPGAAGDAVLTITTDNAEEVYFNGVRLSRSSDWSQGSIVTLPLQFGENVVAVRATDAGGVAAMVAEIAMPDGSTRVTDSSWKVHPADIPGWEAPGFDDSHWVQATRFGSYGVGPWHKNVSDFPAGSTAQWIWTDAAETDDLALFRYTIVMQPPPLAIETAMLEDATVGEPMSIVLMASGGTGNYTWSADPQTLPEALTLSPEGTLAGIPQTGGTFELAVQVSDGESTVTQTLSLTVIALPVAGAATLHVSTDNAESVYFNGVEWSSSGSWNQGTTVSLPLRRGENVIAIRAADAGGAGAMIAEIEMPDGAVLVSDSSWKVNLTEVPGWQAVGFDDSNWARASTYGAYGVSPWGKQVSGFPSNSTARWIWSSNGDADNLVLFRYTIVTGDGPLVIETTTLDDVLVGDAVHVELSATGGTGSYTWSVDPQSLPGSLVLSADGVLSGTADADGIFEFDVQLADGESVVSRTLSLSVAALPLPVAGDATLQISADNAESVYFNGVLLSSSSDWSQGSTVTLPLLRGENVLAIRAVDAGGAGAMIADLTLPDGSVLISDSSWMVHPGDAPGWQDAAFDDSGWAQATEYGVYGVSPWGKQISGFPPTSTARWIWTGDKTGDDLVLFRYTIVTGDGPLVIETAALDGAVAGEEVNAVLRASGGTGDYAWYVDPLRLPGGLTLTEDGVLFGIPEVDGAFEIEVRVDDGERTTSKVLTLTVLPVPSAGDVTLHVSADNAEAVYFNGVQLSSSEDWSAGTTVTLPLQFGDNVIAIRATDAGGAGAMIAQLILPDGTTLITDSSWKVSTSEVPGWKNVSFDDSGWGAAVSYGVYGVNPWKKRISGFPSNSSARWIWTGNSVGDDLVLFRYKILVE